MQELIKQSGMTIRQFSEFYEIPYNTVRQWYNGQRQAPSWAVKLLAKDMERNKNGEQLTLFP